MTQPQCPELSEIQQACQVLLQCNDALQLKDSRPLQVIQQAMDCLSPGEYQEFCARGLEPGAEELSAWYHRQPILHYYDAAFEKLFQAVVNTTVLSDEVLLFHLYNMGYVVKTPTQCFAIDLHHRQSERLVPYLDFCLVTHNHDDHFTMGFLEGMNQAGKKIYSNFYPSYDGYTRESQRRVTIDQTHILCYQSDHNPHLRGFVTPFEIHCNGCVIFTSGDSCNASQLTHSANQVDVHIVHPYVGLDVVEAYKTTVHGRLTLISHLHEFHHALGCFRWSYADGFAAAERLAQAGGTSVVPLWGACLRLGHNKA